MYFPPLPKSSFLYLSRIQGITQNTSSAITLSFLESPKFKFPNLYIFQTFNTSY